MTDQPKKSGAASWWPVYLALGLLVIFIIIFAVEFISSSNESAGEAATELTSDTYMDVVEPLLANANPENGPELLAQYDCSACHIAGAANNIAPSFVGLAESAGEMRPPLTAEAYIYESIIYPQAFIVGDYSGVMALNYASRLSDEQLGDMIAYLLINNTQ